MRFQITILENSIQINNSHNQFLDDLANDVVKCLIISSGAVFKNETDTGYEYSCSLGKRKFHMISDEGKGTLFIYSKETDMIISIAEILSSYSEEYELFTRVRSREGLVGTVVDRMGEDYVLDVGKNANDWDTVMVSPTDIMCRAVIDKSQLHKKVKVLDIDGKTHYGTVTDMDGCMDTDFGAMTICIYNENSGGGIEFYEYEIREIEIIE